MSKLNNAEREAVNNACARLRETNLGTHVGDVEDFVNIAELDTTAQTVSEAINELEDNKATKNTATTTADGLMSKEDKAKIHVLEEAVDKLIGFTSEVVEELPATGEPGVIYLIPNAEGVEQDYYNEYIYVDNKFEKIGNTSTDINLSGYATVTQLNTGLDGKANINHNHDSRYYTEIEMDSKLEDKAGLNTATTTTNGLISKEDKTKLDGIESEANKTVIDDVLDLNSSNPVQNSVITSELNKKQDKTLKTGNAQSVVTSLVTNNGTIFYKIGNVVTALLKFSGTGRGWSENSFTQIATIPEGFRPVGDQVHYVLSRAHNGVFGTFALAHNGKMLLSISSATTFNFSITLTYLIDSGVTLYLAADKTEVVTGESVTLTATLTSGGEGVAGKTVTFDIGGTEYSAITNTEGVATVNYSATGAGDTIVTANYGAVSSSAVNIEDCIFLDKCNSISGLSDNYTALSGSLSSISSTTKEGKECYTPSNSSTLNTITTIPDTGIKIEADTWVIPETSSIQGKCIMLALYNNNGNNHSNRVIFCRISSPTYQFGLRKTINGVDVIDQTKVESQLTDRWVHWTLEITEAGEYTLTNNITSDVFSGTNNSFFTNTYFRVFIDPNCYVANLKIKKLY